MFDAIRKFLAPGPSAKLESTTAPVDTIQNLEHYFRAEITRSTYIRSDAANVVLDHLTGKHDILRSGEKLSTDEKKRLGLNSRQSITRELIGVLSQSGMALPRPAGAIEDIWTRATLRRSRDEQIAALRQSGVRSFAYESMGVETNCEWCNKNFGHTFSAGYDFATEADRECTCSPSARGFIRPIVNFDDL